MFWHFSDISGSSHWVGLSSKNLGLCGCFSPRSQKVRRGRREQRRAREGRRRGDGPSFRMTSKNPGITLPSPLLPRGVSVRRRQRVSGGVRSSLLRGNLVAAVYSLSLISELCRFCLHSGFSNLPIFLVLTELSSPEPSNLDLCSWGGSGVGLYVGLLVSGFPWSPRLDPATPLPESLHQLLKAGSPQPPQTLRFNLLSGQVACFSRTQILPWSPDFTSALCLTLLQFLSLWHQFKVHSSPKTCSQTGNLRRPPWSLQPTLTTPVLLHIWFRSQELAAHSFCPQLHAGSFRAFTMPFTFFSLFPNPRLGSLMD